jgi:peptidoglycan/LPS O-acetylase OafA/YrhL
VSDTGLDRTWHPGIEALRGMAAAVVVVHHLWSLSNMPRFTGYWLVEGFGTFGVDLFFLLSGYLLCDSFWKAGWSLRTYTIRRLYRIVPAYYATVAILFLFFSPPASLWSEFGLRQTLANLTFTHYWFPTRSSSFGVNGALWTLSIEMVLYVVMPILALAFLRFPKLTFVIGCGAGVVWRLLTVHEHELLYDIYFRIAPDFDRQIGSLFIARQFIGYLPVFLIGIAVRRLVLSGRLDRMRTWRISDGGLLAMTGLLAASSMWLVFVERASNYQHWWWFTFWEYVLVVFQVPALLMAWACRMETTPALARKVSLWLGERGYGLYLWHFPLILVFYGRDATLYPPDTSMWFAKIVVICALALLLAHLSFVWIERPMQESGRRRVKRKPADARVDPPVATRAESPRETPIG